MNCSTRHRWFYRFKKLCHQRWIPLLLGIVATIAVLGMWQQLRIHEQLHTEQLVQQQADAIGTELNRELTARISALERMAKRWRAGSGTPKLVWEEAVASNMEDFPGFQAIEWVDSSFQVQWVMPLKGNEAAQNFDLSRENRRQITLRVARDLHQTLLTRTVSLAQGGKGFLACVPLFVNSSDNSPGAERFDGFIVGVFRFGTLFDSILSASLRYEVQIFDQNGLIYNQGVAPPSTLSKTTWVRAYGADWQVQILPTSELIAEGRSLLPELVLWGGLVGAWTLAFMVYLGQRSERYARTARNINQRLQGEIAERQHIEATLRESEERLQLALEASGEGWWDWDITTGEVRRSSQYLKLLGYEVGEFPEALDVWENSIHPDDLPNVMEQLTIHLRDGSVSYACDYRVRTKSGSWQWISDYGKVVVRDAQNNPLRMIGTFKDISDRKAAEVALAESRQRYQNLVENSPDIIERFDLQLRHLYVSPSLTRMTGIPPEAFWGKTCRDLGMDEGMVNAWETAAAMLLRTGQKQVIEFEVPTLAGIRSFEMAIAPELSEQGTIESILCISRDITERKQAELALQESEERFRILVTHAPVGIYQTDAEGRCLYVNPCWMEMTGLSSEAAQGAGWLQALHPDDREAIFTEWTQATREGCAFSLEYRYQQPNGTVIWVSGQAIAVRDETGTVIRYFGTVMDITARKQAEATKQALIESIPDFLVRMRRDGTQLEVLNRGAVQIIQPGGEEIPGTSITDVMPVAIAQERIDLAQKALASHTVQTQEYEFELNGAIVYEEARIAPLGTDEVLVVVRDITERYRAEQALRDSEEKFRQLAENIHQVFFILSAEGEMLYVSSAYEHIWQQSCESLYADPRSWLQSVHSEDRPRIAAVLHNQISRQQSFDETYRIVRQDGEVRWIAAQSFPLKDEAGKVVRFTGIAEDITRQKQVEEALRQSEATKQAIIEAIPDLLIRMRADGAYLDFISNSEFNVVNPSHLRQDATLSEVLPPNLAQLRMHYVQLALQSGMTQIYEQKIWIEGKQRHEEVRIVPLQQDEVLTMVRDITDRKQAEQDLRHQKEMFQAIVNHIPVMIALFNSDDRAEFINPEFEQVLGWSLQDWHQRDVLWECYPDPAYRQIVAEHMRAVDGRWKDFTTLTKTGQLIETSWTNVRLSNGSNLGIGQDISDRKRKEIALRQAMEAAEAANLAKSMFLANMSHELRTPLNVILGFAQVMAHDPSLTPDQQEDLQTIRRSGDHLLSLINDVLDLSKIEAGHCTIEATGFDLIALLHSLRNMFSERAASKKIWLHFDIAPDVPQFVLADAQKLRQVLLNLFSNAIKFTNQGGVTLRVNVGCEGARQRGNEPPSPYYPITLQFEVTDTGIGIAPEETDLIFDAFVQAQAGRKSASGTGLGLTISRKLVELMGGTMSVRSSLEQGSTFTFTLPVYPCSGANIENQQSNRLVIGLASRQSHHRILVVDDQQENRLLLVRLLTQLGLEVREAANGQEAIRIWREWQPALTWMDIRMPGLDGYETTRQIRAMEQGKASIIIALTAQASQSDRTLALAAGCNDYISKPFREETLFLKMREYLGLEYLYAAPSPSQNAEALSLDSSLEDSFDHLDQTALAALPQHWISELEDAAVCGHDAAIVKLAAQLPPELADFANHLTELANQYQFEKILTLVHHHPR